HFVGCHCQIHCVRHRHTALSARDSCSSASCAGSVAEVRLVVARPCAMRSRDLPFSHRIERTLERQGILVAGLHCLMSQVGGACGMPVQVVECRCSVCPIERLPVPPGLHAAADNAQQLLPL